MVDDYEWTKQYETEKEKEKEKGRMGSPPVVNTVCTGLGGLPSAEQAQRVLRNSR